MRLPGLLYAAVRNAPTFGGQASGFTVKGSLPKGVETVIIVPGGIAAIGASWWRANKLLKEGIDVQWQPGPEPGLDSATLWKRYEELMESGQPALTRTLGNDGKPATDANNRSDLSRAVPRAHADGADELHGPGSPSPRRRRLDAQPVADPDAAGRRPAPPTCRRPTSPCTRPFWAAASVGAPRSIWCARP